MVVEATLCAHSCARCGVKREASRLYRPGKFDVSSNHVSSKDPFELAASGTEFRMMAIATRFCWYFVALELSRHVRMLRAPKRPVPISQHRSTIASNKKSEFGEKKRKHS